MASIKKLNFMINRKNKILYLISIISTIITVFFTLVTPLYVTFFIDSVLDNKITLLPKAINNFINMIGGIEFLKVNLWASGLIIIGLNIINALFYFFKERSASIASESSIKFLKDSLYNHLQRLPYDYLNNSQTGDLIQRCTSDVETIRKFISTQAMEIIRIIILMIITLIIMFNINIKLTFLSVISFPIILAVSLIFFVKVKSAFTKVDIKEGELTTALQENLSGVRVVRAFGREKYEMDKFQKKNDEFKELTFKLIKILAYFWGGTDVICLSQITLVVVSSVLMANRNEITVGVLILFITYANMLVWPLRQLGRLLSDFGKMQVSLIRVFEILEAEEEKDTEGAIEHDLSGDIVFENVCFKFDDDESNLLKDITFTAKQGQTIAILGSTGSGKSTLMLLLLRLYDYDSGSIKINGVELRNIQKKWIRSKIGMVLQEPFLYSRTIKENLKMARVNVFDSEIYDATKTAAVHGVIKSFDRGYDTIVGEKGITLSGGQKQRIAIARTLIKNSQILIFDDSLSAVDTETDSIIRKELKETSTDTITFLISQRINTLKDSDLIIVMEKGRITDQGTHEELIQRDGLYYRIWNIQNMLETQFDDEVM